MRRRRLHLRRPAPAPHPPAPAHTPGPQAHLSGKDRTKNARQCLRVELARKQTMMHYQPHKDRLFLRVVLAGPNLVAPCRSEPRWCGGRHVQAGMSRAG